MIYVTLLDQFHPGIYSSQVIDVCDYLNKRFKARIRIVAFLSIREIYNTDAKKRLKELSPSAIVLPAFPGIKNFQLTSFLLFFVCLFTGERVAICRSAFATTTALKVRKWGMLKKVIMDGRSALFAEMKEYDVFPVDYLRHNLKRIEMEAVTNSDYRMAVSQKLISYWQNNYNYSANKQVVIPCTLDGKHFSRNEFSLLEETVQIKKELGFMAEDIILVYAGSTAPWQSFALLENFLSPILHTQAHFKILFLSKNNEDNKRMKEKYPHQVFVKWVEHKDVLAHLQCCDYGLLLREQSDTNVVASPVKFAEYLYGGLKVLISENLGDFSQFVREHNCGYVINKKIGDPSFMKKMDLEEKIKSFELSQKYFRKDAVLNDNAYKQLLAEINRN
ncbi:MAG: hypothetical protein ABI315_09400 [Bacteroidia bacterium]